MMAAMVMHSLLSVMTIIIAISPLDRPLVVADFVAFGDQGPVFVLVLTTVVIVIIRPSQHFLAVMINFPFINLIKIVRINTKVNLVFVLPVNFFFLSLVLDIFTSSSIIAAVHIIALSVLIVPIIVVIGWMTQLQC